MHLGLARDTGGRVLSLIPQVGSEDPELQQVAAPTGKNKALWFKAFSWGRGAVLCLVQVWLGSPFSVPNFADSEDYPVHVKVATCDQQDGLAGTLLALHTWQPYSRCVI